MLWFHTSTFASAVDSPAGVPAAAAFFRGGGGITDTNGCVNIIKLAVTSSSISISIGSRICYVHVPPKQTVEKSMGIGSVP